MLRGCHGNPKRRPHAVHYAVDLGGTNCRFAGFTLDKGILSLHRMGKRKTAELPDTGALISACGTALDRHPRTADAFVVGMAGPSPIR